MFTAVNDQAGVLHKPGKIVHEFHTWAEMGMLVTAINADIHSEHDFSHRFDF
jgi:hypothetical protein